MLTCTEMIERLITAARQDPRIVGLMDCGSSNHGSADEWSDLDVAVFIRDVDIQQFSDQWKAWAGRLGKLMLGYISGVGHPWTVYETAPIPLRVDFSFVRESEIETILQWPQSPTSVQSAVWYDATGRLSACVQKLVGQDLGPADLHVTFDQVCGDFWYYCLRTYGKVKRDQLWTARWELTFIVHGNLIALLKLEAGATERWRSTSAPVGIEKTLSRERLKQLDDCIPDHGARELKKAFINTANLGYLVCDSLAHANGWEWPQELAQRVLDTLDNDEWPRS